MAIASRTAALAMLALAAGTQYVNTKNVERKQDNAAADQIRNQSKHQREADAKVNDEVTKLKGSTSADEKAKALSDYMAALVRNRNKIQTGLTPEGVGSSAFGTDKLQAASGVDALAANNANLMARMDAPTMQRQGEGFGFGQLATDLGLIGRKASGDNYLDELRLRGIRRNAGLDLAAGLLSAGAGAVGAGAASAPQAAGGTFGTLAGGAYSGLGTTPYAKSGGTFGTLKTLYGGGP